MKDYDVVVVGGGINGLTCAAYLAKSGLSVGVFEARGQCGAHCDTVELGIPGFLHNLHATWLATTLSPAMDDLDLPGFGFEPLGTDILYAKPFLNGKNLLHGIQIPDTNGSFAKSSERDAATQLAAVMYFAEHLEELLDVNRLFWFTPPSHAVMARMIRLVDGFLAHVGAPYGGQDLMNMNGYEVLETLFESDEVRTTTASLAWIGAMPPIQRKVGSLASILLGGIGGPMPVHTARGGSHALTHALVKCVVAHGGEIWTTCPVEKILVEDGKAHGIRLSADALLPGEEITARRVVSNLTAVPTFIRLLGEDVIGEEKATIIRGFNYDDQVLFGVYYSLKDDVEWASAEWDPGIQRAMMGYWGGDTLDDMRDFGVDLISGVINDKVMGNWFIPTRADPSQAPAGCHTTFLWLDVPPCPRKWRGRKLNGWDAWGDLAEPLADAITDQYEEYAPGFKDLVLERFVMTPPDQERNNPSAIKASMVGGSVTPEQYYTNRPVLGVLEGGASRTFVPNLYISNSIHPVGASWLASGYLAAREVAEDAGTLDAEWWQAKPYDWFLGHMTAIPLNRGVGEKWKVVPEGFAS